MDGRMTAAQGSDGIKALASVSIENKVAYCDRSRVMDEKHSKRFVQLHCCTEHCAVRGARPSTSRAGAWHIGGCKRHRLGDGQSVMEKVRAALSKDMKRTLDFFRACDEDYSGAVDRKEFRKAIDKIVPGVTKGVCAALFDMIDKDKSDTIEYDEINAQLRQREDMRPISRGRVMMARPSRNVRIEKYKRQLSKA